MRRKPEAGGKKPEVRGQWSEDRSQESGARNQEVDKENEKEEGGKSLARVEGFAPSLPGRKRVEAGFKGLD